MGNSRSARRRIQKNMGKKSQAVIEAETRAGQMQMSLLNMRQMYESAIQEKMALQQALDQTKGFLAALIYPELEELIPNDNLDAIQLGEVVGMNTQVLDDGILIELVLKEDEDESDEE